MSASVYHIRRALARPLPGLEAQLRLCPRPRLGQERVLTTEWQPREGAVLLLLYPAGDELHLVLTRRTDTLGSHRGQISLPGGRREAGESLSQAALREAYEEIGLPPASVEIFGALTPVPVPVSNHRVTPFVGYIAARPDFRPDPGEVAELIEVPLALLLERATVREEEWMLHGQRVQVPFFALGRHKVWGATAMILSEFVEALRAPHCQPEQQA